MALTKQFLTALGIEPEKADQIIEAHTEVTETLRKERDSYKADAEKLSNIQKQLDEANKKISESEDFKSQLETLKNEISVKETAEKKSGALKKILKEKGYSEKGIEKITKYGGYLDGIDFDENGAVKEQDKLVSQIESEWGEYKPTENTSYTEPSTPPESKASGSTKSEAAKYAEAYYNRIYGEKKEA